MSKICTRFLIVVFCVEIAELPVSGQNKTVDFKYVQKAFNDSLTPSHNFLFRDRFVLANNYTYNPSNEKILFSTIELKSNQLEFTLTTKNVATGNKRVTVLNRRCLSQMSIDTSGKTVLTNFSELPVLVNDVQPLWHHLDNSFELIGIGLFSYGMPKKTIAEFVTDPQASPEASKMLNFTAGDTIKIELRSDTKTSETPSYRTFTNGEYVLLNTSGNYDVKNNFTLYQMCEYDTNSYPKSKNVFYITEPGKQKQMLSTVEIVETKVVSHPSSEFLLSKYGLKDFESTMPASSGRWIYFISAFLIMLATLGIAMRLRRRKS